MQLSSEEKSVVRQVLSDKHADPSVCFADQLWLKLDDRWFPIQYALRKAGLIRFADDNLRQVTLTDKAIRLIERDELGLNRQAGGSGTWSDVSVEISDDAATV
ncbi:MAG: hypothetical protein ACF8SC_13365 [Phycisphaerales bacterium JB037]